jgi:hypothetical protein
MNGRQGNVLKAAKVLFLGVESLKPRPTPSSGKGFQLSKLATRLIKGKYPVLEHFSNAAKGLAKEAEIGPQLHEETIAALQRMQEMSADLKQLLSEAYGFAAFPSVARAALVIGVTYGKGEVFVQNQVIGYAGIIQVTGGVQIGGETVHILVLINDEKALDRLKTGKTSFAANASVGIVKTGATAAKGPYGLRIFMYPEGGEMLEAAIGGQSIKFKPAVQGRLRSA